MSLLIPLFLQMAWSLLLAACLLSSLAMADPLRSDRAPEEAAPAKDQSENDREGKCMHFNVRLIADL